MSDENKNLPNIDVPLEGHNYDGIQEFNNPAPFWWQLFFYLSIVFGLGYYTYYELLDGKTSDQELQAKLNEVKIKQISQPTQEPDEGGLLAVFQNPTRVQLGHEIFEAKCASCHAKDGGGLVGPNLTDAYWIHGKGKLVDIFRVVRDGVLDKGMPPWGATLKPEEVENVSVFVKTLKGAKVVTSKAPQGEKVSD